METLFTEVPQSAPAYLEGLAADMPDEWDVFFGVDDDETQTSVRHASPLTSPQTLVPPAPHGNAPTDPIWAAIYPRPVEDGTGVVGKSTDAIFDMPEPIVRSGRALFKGVLELQTASDTLLLLLLLYAWSVVVVAFLMKNGVLMAAGGLSLKQIGNCHIDEQAAHANCDNQTEGSEATNKGIVRATNQRRATVRELVRLYGRGPRVQT